MTVSLTRTNKRTGVLGVREFMNFEESFGRSFTVRILLSFVKDTEFVSKFKRALK